MAASIAAGRDPCRSLSRQRVFSRRQIVGPDRFLFCLHRYPVLRRRGLSQRLVLRGRSFLQRDQGTRAAQRLQQSARAVCGRAERTACTRARRRNTVPSHAAGRLAGRAGRRAGAAEGPARILPKTALPPVGEKRRGLRALMSEQRVTIHTDGACSGNPGPGGWGAILAFGDHEKELMGGEPHTTNNRMELMAAISALEALKRPCTVDLHTDSEYLKNGITSWIHGWKKNGWRTADKKPVKNIDLWKRLDEALALHKVQWHWIKGHAGHAMNERADELAREGIVAARAGAIGAMRTK